MKIETLNNSMSNIDTVDGLTEMSMDVHSVRTLMNILTEMYPDPEGAAIREYTTNATDSHIESGQKRPVEITLPTAANPTFTVQDWGIGMGKWELENIYGVYGKSTKRDSNDVNGAFGLGSKSALAYTPAFKLTTIKNGMLFKVLVNKNAKGSGQLRITNGNGEGEPTNLPNGVTIHIPVPLDSVESFATKAEATYMLFKPGTLLVDGEAPKTLADSGFHAISDFAYLNRNGTGSHRLRIAMGGVTYRVSGLSYQQIDTIFKPNFKLRYRDLVLIADMAEVNIAPSREDVLLDAKTLRFITESVKEVNDYLKSSAIEEIDAAKDGLEALKVIETYKDLLNVDISYKGVEYKSSLKVPNIRNYYWTNRVKKRQSSNIGSYEINLASDSSKNYIFDTSNASDAFKAAETFQRYVNAYTEHILDHDRIGYQFLVLDVNVLKGNIFAKGMLDAGLFEIVDIEKAIEDVKAFHKSNRATRVSGGTRGALTYPAQVFGANGSYDYESMTINDLRSESKVYYFETAKNIDHSSHFRGIAQNGDVLVEIAAGRSAEAFIKRLGDDVELVEVTPMLAKHVESQLAQVSFSLESFIAKRISEDNYRSQYFINAVSGAELVEKLDDPIFVKVCGIRDSSNDASKVIMKNRGLLESMSRFGSVVTDDHRNKFLKVSGALTEAEKKEANKVIADFERVYDIIFRAYYNAAGDRQLGQCVVMANALYAHENASK